MSWISKARRPSARARPEVVRGRRAAVYCKTQNEGPYDPCAMSFVLVDDGEIVGSNHFSVRPPGVQSSYEDG